MVLAAFGNFALLGNDRWRCLFDCQFAQ